jgi:hypothetical protein
MLSAAAKVFTAGGAVHPEPVGREFDMRALCNWTDAEVMLTANAPDCELTTDVFVADRA